MPRPRKTRLVRCAVKAAYFKPRGIPLSELDELVLSVDGFEAMRLADAEGIEHLAAAEMMGISRSTFSRLLAEARQTVASALTRGAAIRIAGGPVARPEVEDGAGFCRRRAAMAPALAPHDEPSRAISRKTER